MGVASGHYTGQQCSSANIRTMRMQTKLIVFTLLVCFFVGCYAPFPRSDPRSVLNPLIEPWWCRVPKIMREFLHLKFTFSPLNERGPCTVPSGRFNKADFDCSSCHQVSCYLNFL